MTLHDPEGFRQLVKEQVNSLRVNREYLLHKKFGTTEGAISRNMLGVYPTKNFRFGEMDGYQQLSPEAYMERRVDEFGCYGCPARCGKKHLVPFGAYAGIESEGPEYESIWAFSGPIDSNNIDATIAADRLCDALGLDTISTGNCIGFAYELYEKGILTKADTDGLELDYGNHSAMIELIKKISCREGFGNILAEGALRAARHIGKGAEAYAMHVKGLELPGYEPRGLKATGFGYATSSIGGSHGNGSLAFQEWGVPVPRVVDRFTEDGKADIVIFNQNNSALGEVGCICAFARSWGDWYRRLFGKMLVAATGIEEFAEQTFLAKVGEKLVNLERAFNVREGFTRTEDTLPQRFLSEPLHTLKAEGEGQMIRSLDKFLDEYYHLRGWTSEGIPTSEKLEELGLGYIIEDMRQPLREK